MRRILTSHVRKVILPERALKGGRQAAPVIKCGNLRVPRMLCPPRPASWCHDAIPSRLLSGSGGEAGKGNGDKKGGMVDVQGGKVEDTSRAEGHLVWAERAKNIVAAHRRFQLTTYNRLPNDLNDEDTVFVDVLPGAGPGFKASEAAFSAERLIMLAQLQEAQL